MIYISIASSLTNDSHKKVIFFYTDLGHFPQADVGVYLYVLKH